MLDLFSGIGGMTLALRGVAEPVAFCDVDPFARAVIELNQRRGRLPRVPVYDDIHTLHDVPRVTVVAAGFPCNGFSSAGDRKGFAHPDTGLFFRMLHVIDAARPRLIFLENVPGIVRMGLKTVRRELARRRYSMRWCLLSASDIGAPHRRKRWFCVAFKSAADLPRQDEFVDSAYTWSTRTEPARVTERPPPWHARRLRALGNALVPDAARAAFRHLSAASAVDDDGRVQGPEASPKYLDLVFDPQLFRHERKPSPQLSAPVRTSAVAKRLWATPTTTTSPNNNMTVRSDHVLPTQVRFERRTPDHLRGGTVSPRFVEWLMGFPLGWTGVPRRP